MIGQVIFRLFPLKTRGSVPDGRLVGIASALPNNVYIGIPVMTPLFGRPAMIAIILSTWIFIMLVSGISILLESKNNRQVSAMSSIVKIVKNPLLISILLGIIAGQYSSYIPSFIINSTNTLSSAVVPLALFIVGFLLSEEIKSSNKKVGHQINTLVHIEIILSLLFQPVIALLFSHLFNLSHLWTQMTFILFCLPSGITLVMIATKLGIGSGTITRISAVGTVYSIVTLVLATQLITLHMI